MYKLIRNILFLLPPECAHHITLKTLGVFAKLGLLRCCKQPASQPVEVFGLKFPNPVGLAAGLDKNAEYIDGLAALGFGFIEVGTVTPRPQPGNPKPRMFRLTKHNALINRLGFNNNGVDALIANIQRSKYKGILGINIGKNFDTPLEKAFDDYLICYNKVYPYASYITVNISSPNTPGLRDLQQGDSLEVLVAKLKQAQQQCAQQHNKLVPLLIKIAPDLTDDQIQQMAQVFLANQIDGVIATNTTLEREQVKTSKHAAEKGGLSGAPLTQMSNSVIEKLNQALGGNIPIIGVGGIMNSADAKQKFANGASLVQIYTGFIYKGPGLIKEICLRN